MILLAHACSTLQHRMRFHSCCHSLHVLKQFLIVAAARRLAVGAHTQATRNTCSQELLSKAGLMEPRLLVQVFPVVESVSGEGGSLAGGHVLRVRGRGFGSVAAAVSVDIAGMPCHVLAAQDTLLTCVTAPWDASLSWDLAARDCLVLRGCGCAVV